MSVKRTTVTLEMFLMVQAAGADSADKTLKNVFSRRSFLDPWCALHCALSLDHDVR